MGPIKNIQLKFGAKSGSAPLSLFPSGVTIFVGPNNSGKSLILREIEKYCSVGMTDKNKIIANVELSLPDKTKVLHDLTAQKDKPNENENVPEGAIVVQRINSYPGLRPREIVNLTQVDAWLRPGNSVHLARSYYSFLTVRLDASTRTNLLNPQNRGDLLAPPSNILAALFVNREARERIRSLTSELFQSHFVIDALNAGQLRARLSVRGPKDETEEQALDTRAREFHRNAMEIIEASDGVKAFTGMIATVIGKNYRIPLIDEPEAFLHPPLARRLGKELAESASEKQANVFAATHSADFLMGCVIGSPKVNIVRLTYAGGKATARLLEPERLNAIIKSPLMSSTGVLSALFHKGAIICEGDSDRALYQEVNDRLIQSGVGTSAEAIFINAHGKQSTAKIAGPLREMGIPAAIVVDFDIFKDNSDFKNILKDLNIPPALISSWGQAKALISQYCVKHDIDWKRKGLSDIHDSDMHQSTDNLLDNLASYGIFVVANGELEVWLQHLGIADTKNKQYWLLKIFDMLGSDPTDTSYIKPTEGDVWLFIQNIANWIDNPDRQGI